MSNVLQILVEQASEKVDECAKAMGNSKQNLAKAEEKMVLLENYREECQAGMHNNATGGITGSQLRNQLAFVEKISAATVQQSNEIRFLKTALEQQVKEWQLAMAKQRKYLALLDREKVKKLALENKRDQKMNDEFAARIFRVKTAGEST